MKTGEIRYCACGWENQQNVAIQIINLSHGERMHLDMHHAKDYKSEYHQNRPISHTRQE
jgi:hypothetical protein